MTDIREKVVTIRRTVAASPDFLFAAWTDQALFAQWFGPRSWTVDRCELDVRVGGVWRAWFRRADGTELYTGGTYLELDPPNRVVFTWDTDPDGSASEMLSVVRVAFSEVGPGTEIEISHRKLGTAQAVDMDTGWATTLDALEDFLSAQTIDLKEGNPK